MQQKNKPILCKAAIAYKAKQEMRVQNIWVAAPKQGQIRIKVICNALCHTDVYRLDGLDPQGQFPCILGHQATAIVESIGQGVTSVQIGDIIIPCYTPQCKEKNCIYCCDERTNLCPKIRTTQGKGLMPDGTSRFTTEKGEIIYHFMGCSTFSQYTVISEISAAKINPYVNINNICLIGCGISTGWGVICNNRNLKITNNCTIAIWGLGAVGLSIAQAAKIKGIKKIYGIDINQNKFIIAKKFGIDICYKPTKQKSAKQFILQHQKWGVNYTFDCTGSIDVMNQALQSSHRGYGQSCIVGVAQAGKQIHTKPFQLITGRKWLGSAFGGWKSRTDVPKLVNKVALGELLIDQYCTHKFDSLEQINQTVRILHQGKSLRSIVQITPQPVLKQEIKIKTIKTNKLYSGYLKTITHWSSVTNTFMNFNIFLPQGDIFSCRNNTVYPALYFLAGLTSTHDNAAVKSGFAEWAIKYQIAVIFPDTSPRNTNIANISSDWQYGDSASYYLDATTQETKKYFQMFTYITKELPLIVSNYFPVSSTNISITGFSMGGHGALICALKTKLYRSVSAFSPMCNPTQCQNWGKKAFNYFFKKPQQQGKLYDSTEILKTNNYTTLPMLIQIGSLDQYKQNLLIQNLQQQLNKLQYKHQYKIRQGYNHSFYYVSTFLQQHFKFHSKYLQWYKQE